MRLTVNDISESRLISVTNPSNVRQYLLSNLRTKAEDPISIASIKADIETAIRALQERRIPHDDIKINNVLIEKVRFFITLIVPPILLVRSQLNRDGI